MTTLREAFGGVGIQTGTSDAPNYEIIVEALRAEYLGAATGMPNKHGARREKAAARLALYRDDFKREIELLIEKVYSHKDVRADRERMAQMVGFLNVPKRITDEVASLYDIPAKRRFADDQQAERFTAVERELDLHSVMKEAHRLCFWLNNVLLWHVDRGGGTKRTLRIVTPDRFDVVPNPTDALDLVAVIIDCAPAWVPSLLTNTAALPHWEIWDSEVRIVVNGAGRIIEAKPHGQGRIPGVLMSSRLPVDRLLEDRAGEDIYCAARAVLFLNLCTLSLSLDASEQQPWLRGVLSEMAADQAKTAGRALALPPGVEIGSLDLVTDPDHLLKVVRHTIASVAQSYGMSYEQFTFQETADTASGKAYTVRRQKLTEMRIAQRQRALVHERDVSDLLGYPDAQAPDFHEQEVPTDPLEEMDLFDRRCARGLDNPIAYLQRKDTDLSVEDATRRFLANITVTAWLFTLLRMKNLSLTGTAGAPGQTPEENGAMGPQAKDDANSKVALPAPKSEPEAPDLSWVEEVVNAAA